MTDRDDILEPFFDAARRSDATPGDDLMARVLADAVVPAVPDVTATPAPPFWDRLLDVIGGWPAMGSVMAAGLAGLWIGVAPPAGVEDFAAGLLGGTETVSIYVDPVDAGLEALDG